MPAHTTASKTPHPGHAVDALVARVRGEYREMPGLSLTLPQACRLWHLDPVECKRIFETLVDEHFLRCTPTGAFVALPGRRRVDVVRSRS